MSYPTSPYLLFDNQQSVNREPFSQLALGRRFGAYSPTAQYNCATVPVDASNPAMVVSAPCCPEQAGHDVLGIGYNNGILNYQFGSAMNTPFCGVPLSNTTNEVDCQKCPCQTPGCNVNNTNSPCNYGYARNHASAFGPSGGNRNGNLKWGG